MQKDSAAMNKPREHSRRDKILRRIKSILFENWGTKLLAILIAIGLWAGLITQDPDLTREKQFNDVDVSVMGADSLRRNGYIVLDDTAEVLSDVDVRVSVPQGQYTTVQPSNYSIRVDLSRITSAGEQEVKILSSNSAAYGTVTEINPPSVTLTVDEYVTRYRIPVTVVTEGEAPEGFYAAEPSTDPPMIAVSGPKTLVERIVSAQVVVDQTTLPAREGTQRRALTFALVDENGQVIESSLLQVTSESVLLDTIIVEQTVYSLRTVDLADLGLVTGQPAEGYEIRGVYVTPASITVAGRASALEDISLLYADGSVNVSGLTESVNKSIKVRQSSALKYISSDSVTVAVEIGPVITTRAYDTRVELNGLAATLREAGGIRTATVYITGAQPWLETLESSDLSLVCDLSVIAEPGTYVLPLTCTVKDNEGQSYTCEINPASVVVTVLER